MKKNIPIVFILFFIIFLCATACMNKTVHAVSYAYTDNSVNKTPRIGYIYTGDSRIRRLNLTIGMNKIKDTWVVCKSGMGYSWFTNTGIPKIKKIRESHPEIDKWVIISGWGVNDLWNYNSYVKKYTALMKNEWKGCNLFLLSVNPVNGRMTSKYGSVVYFNTRLESYLKNYNTGKDDVISFINTYKVLKEKGFSTIDGLHYSEKTNALIYKTVRSELDNKYTRIDYSALTLNYNSRRTISLCDNHYYTVKWKNSNKSVVKIVKTSGDNNEKATIQALSPGIAVISAKTGKRTYSCTVTVFDKKVLVAYFSYSGATMDVAKYIYRRIGGDLFEIDPDIPYPLSGKEILETAKREFENDERPACNSINDISLYPEIYLGFPLWYGKIPRIICAFLEKYDLNEKNIYPFVTNGGGGFDDSISNYEIEFAESITELADVASGSAICAGINLDRSYSGEAKGRKKIRKWLKSN